MKFIIGKKLNMTQVFRGDGIVVPVTKIVAGPCSVTQVKTKEKDGVESIQVGFGIQKKFRLNKPKIGHLKGIEVENNPGLTVRNLREMKIEVGHGLKKGDKFTVKIFTPGEKVTVIGRSKGKGFQGVVRRHHFHGGPASHGHKDNLRMPGSIGASGIQRVLKGIRMAGHMGDERVTVKNLEVIEVNPETNEILLKGAVPGARNGLLLIYTGKGNIEIESEKLVEEVSAVEEKKEVENQPENTSVNSPENK